MPLIAVTATIEMKFIQENGDILECVVYHLDPNNSAAKIAKLTGFIAKKTFS